MWALVFLVIFTLALSLVFFETVHVGDGYVAVLERFGRFVRVLQPGSHLIFRPMHSLRWTHFSVEFERQAGNSSTTTEKMITHRMIPTRRQVYDPPAWPMQTSDGVTVEVNVAVFYIITDARAACYATSNYLAAVRESVRRSIKLFVQDTSVHRLHALMTQSTMHTILDEEYLESVGIAVEEVRLQNIEFPRRIQDETIENVVALRTIEANCERADALHAAELRRLEQQQLIERRQVDHETKMLVMRCDAENAAIGQYKDSLDLQAVAAWRASAHATKWSINLVK